MFGSGEKDKLESIIGKNTQFTGDIVSKGTLRIDGRVVGNVEADCLVMGEKSFLKGNCRIGSLVLAGAIEGNVMSKDAAEIKRTGQIKGDLATAKLIVIEGGIIDGNISMQREGSKVVDLTQEIRREAAS